MFGFSVFDKNFRLIVRIRAKGFGVSMTWAIDLAGNIVEKDAKVFFTVN